MKRALAVAALVALTLLSSSVGAVAAQDTPQPIENDTDYYNNETGQTNTTSWVPGDGNVTVVGILDMISRVPGMFIGVGEQDPSGSGYQGVLLTALVIGAATLFATVGIDIGPVAGSMLGMVIAYGMTTVGLIPTWIQPILLFTIVGVPASAALLQVFNR